MSMSLTPHDYDRPLPETSTDSAPYWAGLRAHELRLQRCTACGLVRHYPRPLCPRCFGFDCDWLRASGRGTVHSSTIAHHAFHPGFKRAVPYALVTVDLPEGVRLAAPLAADAATPLAIGQPVSIGFDDVAPGLTLPCVKLGSAHE
jgi:hypothetical protein